MTVGLVRVPAARSFLDGTLAGSERACLGSRRSFFLDGTLAGSPSRRRVDGFFLPLWFFFAVVLFFFVCVFVFFCFSWRWISGGWAGLGRVFFGGGSSFSLAASTVVRLFLGNSNAWECIVLLVLCFD